MLEVLKNVNPGGVLSSTCGEDPELVASFSATIGRAFGDAYHAVEDAYALATDLTLGVADSELSTTNSLSVATYRSMSAVSSSRAKAVQLQVGGALKWDQPSFVFPGQGIGFCTQTRLSPQAESALRLIRDAAPPPDLVLAMAGPPDLNAPDVVSIDAFVNGSGTGSGLAGRGSIRERLNDKLAQQLTGSDGEGSFLGAVGLRLSDFDEARRYLAQELLAFSRSRTQILPNTNVSAYAHYASTAAPPASRSSAYYAAIARSSPVKGPTGLLAGSCSEPNWYRDVLLGGRTCKDSPPEFACTPNYYDYAYAGSELEQFRGLTLLAIDRALLNATDANTKVLSALLTVADAIRSNARETVDHRFGKDATTSVAWQDLWVDAAASGHGYRLVMSEDALQCYTMGTIEGVPCDAEAKNPEVTATWRAIDLLPDASVDPPVAYRIVPGDPHSIATGTRWYVLRTKSGGQQPAHLNGDDYQTPVWNVGAGEWEAVTGFPYVSEVGDSLKNGETLSRRIAVFSDIEQKVADILAPDRGWCAQSEKSCLGFSESDPIPLEDELSADGSDHETSWQHYMSLAKDAAAKSDALAQEYIGTGLSVDEFTLNAEERAIAREEKIVAALDRVQQICGTAVDPELMLRALGGGNGEFKTEDLIDPAGCQPGDGEEGSQYDCIANHRMKSWDNMVEASGTTATDGETQLSELEQLRECLSESSDSTEATKEYVHLGDAALCVPDKCGEEYCKKLSPEEQETCPADCPLDVELAKADANGVPTCDTVYTRVDAERGLSFFDTRAALISDTNESICGELRKARALASTSAFDAIAASPQLAYANLRNLPIEVTPKYGDYLTVTVGNKTWTTGTPTTGPGDPNGPWPCGPQGMPPECSNPAFSASLLCSTIDCSNRAERAELNGQLEMAALAAKLALWEEPDSFSVTVPAYVYGGLRPAGGHETPLPLWDSDGATIRTFSSGAWTVFEGTLGSGVSDHAWTEASHYVRDEDDDWSSSTKSWFLHDPTPPSEETPGNDGPPLSAFAFARVSATPKESIAGEFWKGIGTVGGGDGCLKKALLMQLDSMQACDTVLESEPVGWSERWCLLADCGHTPNIEKALDQASLEFPGGDAPESPRVPFESTSDGFRWYMAWYDVPPDDDHTKGSRRFLPTQKIRTSFLDGVEMLCSGSEGADGTGECDGTPPELKSVAQLSTVGSYIECLGKKLNNRGAKAVFRELPSAALDPFRDTGTSIYETASGEVGQGLGDLRIALMDVYKIFSATGHQIRQFGSEMKALQAAFEAFKAEENMADVTFESQQANEIASCLASASSSLGSVDPLATAGRFGAAAATCANSFAQIRFADRLRDLKKEQVGAEKEQAIARFNGSFSDMAKTLDEQSTDLAEALERVNMAIGRLGSMRSEAQRAFGQALWMMSRGSGAETNVQNGLTNRKALALARYKRAELNARKLAYLAKRGVEQRLGVRLSEMHEELPLVEPPASWESNICTSAGVDYELMRQAELSENQIESLADSFIGDYVTRLENVVESYRLTQGFQDGKDKTILSLRDDVVDARAPCEKPSHNLLLQSEALDDLVFGYSETNSSPWYVSGCKSEDGVMMKDNCVHVEPADEQVRPAESAQPGHVFRIQSGVEETCSTEPDSATCGWQEGAALLQRVTVEPGVYALTWHERRLSGAGAQVDGLMLGESISGLSEPGEEPSSISDGSEPPTWYKRWRFASVTERDHIDVGFAAKVLPDGTWVKTAELAAPMLERLGDLDETFESGVNLGAYEQTDTEGLSVRTDCEDTDGVEFRKFWKRGCQKLCDDGYSSDCSGSAKSECYWELSFPVSQRAIDAGDLGLVGGFARGNFNYRINRLGLNLVGTGVRDCENANLSQACNGNGFATYTIEHQGPYLVRNHMGTDYQASLFTGRIEHARGLATERYITNPLGSADTTLLEGYMRTELAGRPLGGTYVVRLWEEEGFDFSSVEDVQLVLDYGYWTRLD